MSGSRAHVVIVGGGIAGLAAAYRLRQLAAPESLQITVLECDDRLGGKLLSERTEDFVIEAGPDSFLASKPAALRLAEELGIGERIINTRSGGGTFILCRGALEPLPEGFSGLVPTKLGPLMRSRLLGRRGKLRLQLEPWIPARQEAGDESVADFMRRRLGREAYERIAQPLLSGIYAGDAEQMSLLSTFPQLRQQEQRYGSLLRAMRARQVKAAQNGQPPSPPSPSLNGKHPPAHRTPFLSLRGGIGELTDALARAIDEVDIRLGTAVETVMPSPMASGYRVRLGDGSSLEAEAVLLATPAWASAGILECCAPELSRVLSQIPYVSTATISLAYRRQDLPQLTAGRGFVIPAVEHRELTAVTVVSDKFADRAPDDMVLLRCFVGRAGREEMVDLPDKVLATLVKAELREILGIQATPSLVRVYRWQRAMPQYTLGHPARLAEIERQLAELPGLHLLGAAYRGVGIPDCIRGAYQAAEQAHGKLVEHGCVTDGISSLKMAHVVRQSVSE